MNFGNHLQPWEPELLAENSVAWSLTDSDAWGPESLLLATDDSGVVFLNQGLSMPLIEPGARIQQLAVEEHFGLFLARIEKGKDAGLIAFPLTDLRAAVQSGQLIRREACLEHRIPTTKG
ncbi:unnamed protein product [Gongylonema pulchrum]|uniref:DUF1828 domain-containing protein n=1 Tax=Gongylonema pulchrum TaxID=637853 RepID=A0A183DEA1_9BILA|nr:unnamed protein product [Gongylonema pulchrum]